MNLRRTDGSPAFVFASTSATGRSPTLHRHDRTSTARSFGVSFSVSRYRRSAGCLPQSPPNGIACLPFALRQSCRVQPGRRVPRRTEAAVSPFERRQNVARARLIGNSRSSLKAAAANQPFQSSNRAFSYCCWVLSSTTIPNGRGNTNRRSRRDRQKCDCVPLGVPVFQIGSPLFGRGASRAKPGSATERSSRSKSRPQVFTIVDWTRGSICRL
jgi:hypothetical protein